LVRLHGSVAFKTAVERSGVEKRAVNNTIHMESREEKRKRDYRKQNRTIV
jgi:hypothetical protein